ncbi:MAG TPA: hypothetical protein VFZ31_16055 [Vicinamibacterales bacterium]
MIRAGRRFARSGRYAFVAVAVVTTVGCQSPTAPFTVKCPSVLTIVAGDNQRAAMSTALPTALEVHATVSPAHRSMFCAGFVFNIAWSVESGGGSVVPDPLSGTIQTNYTARWTLGPAPGPQTVRATVRDSEESPATVVFRAVAEPQQP